jgi:hypothetical protein
MATYPQTSPWYETRLNPGNYLDFMEKRFIFSDPNDILYEIQPQYTYRPDLLAFDLYGSPKLWWVFTIRNPENLKDPVFDFIPGNKIYLPRKSSLSAAIGA